MNDPIKHHAVMYAVLVGVAQFVTFLPEPATPERRTDEVGRDGSQAARVRADVENARVKMEVREDRFRGRGVHVRGGDGCAEANGLSAVAVGGGGRVVSMVDLAERYQSSIPVD